MGIVHAYPDLIGPRFFLEANGTLATDLIPYISKFEYEDDEKKTDTMKLIVLNPGLRFKDDPRFKEGARFRVRFGYNSDISDVKNAVIQKAKPSFPHNGIPTIEMVAFNLQQDMNHLANPNNWGAISSSDVAKAIAKRYNFQTDIEESNDARSQNRLQSANITDIQYLMSLAHPLNWDCYIDGTTLHFHHKRYESPAGLSFTYFTDGTGTLLHFTPEVKMNNPSDAKTAGTNTKDGKTAASADQSTNGRLVNFDTEGPLISVAHAPTAGGGSSMTSSSSESDPKVIAAHGAARSQKIDMSAVKATCEIIGTPRFKARTMVNINGVDQQYSGNWRVMKSKHTFEPKGVYRCSGNLSRDAGKGKTAAENKTGDSGTPVNTVQVNFQTNTVTGQF